MTPGNLSILRTPRLTTGMRSTRAVVDPLVLEHAARRHRGMGARDHVEGCARHAAASYGVRPHTSLMLLAVDVGNTQTHLGAFDGSELRQSWRFQTRAGMTSDELAERISGFMELSGLTLRDVDAARRLVGRSAPRQPSTSPSASATSTAASASWSAPASRRDADPDRQSATRLAPTGWSTPSPHTSDSPALASSWTSAPGSTSTRSRRRASTWAGRSPPGWRSRSPRWRSAAPGSLRSIWRGPAAAIGKSTRSAIESGVVFGFAGLIDGVARRIIAELGEGTPIIATGGLAKAIVPFCETISEVDHLLTLKGLRLIWERNAD